MRSQLHRIVVVMMPLCGSVSLGLALFFALSPRLATSRPLAFTFGVLSASMWALLALSLPLLLASRTRALPRVSVLLQRQMRIVGESCGGGKPSASDWGAIPCTEWLEGWPRAAYLLEGEGYFAVAPREAAETFYTSVSLVFVMTGVAFLAAFAVASQRGAPGWSTVGLHLPLAATYGLVSPALLCRPTRRAFAACVSRLFSGGEEREAAVIAALLGGLDAAHALGLARKTFRGLPISAIGPSDLGSSEDSGLHARTVKLPLGSCDAFVSHSWHDDGGEK